MIEIFRTCTFALLLILNMKFKCTASKIVHEMTNIEIPKLLRVSHNKVELIEQVGSSILGTQVEHWVNNLLNNHEDFEDSELTEYCKTDIHRDTPHVLTSHSEDLFDELIRSRIRNV